MRTFHSFSIIAIIALGLLSCGQGKNGAAADMTAAKAAIAGINARFAEKFKQGDSVALASYYDPDGQMIFPGRDPIKGKGILSAWHSSIKGSVQDSDRNVTFTTTDLAGDSQFLIETGVYEQKTDDGVVKDQGKYIVIWKKQPNGEWKLYRDIGL
ncbi:MAG TPA: nuclear transport factor 2 family protein [Mucilaginibacter sp.]|nr:nuclear transport factor 2 family protein [Mucilaginibacter sp.]